MEEDRSDQRCTERLREKNSEEEGVKIPEMLRIEGFEKEHDDKGFGQGKEENQKGLGRRTFKVDAVLEKLCSVKEKNPGKSKKSKSIS
jgi:hypothetical protein